MIKVQFAARPERWESYQAPLKAAFSQAGLQVDLRQDHPAAEVDYVIYAPNSDLQDFTSYTACKAVLSLWAGVEKITGNTTLTQPLCRMVDPGLTAGMVEWVTGHVLRYHLDLDRSLITQDRWDPVVPPLAQLGFPVTGWSRSAKSIAGITCEHGTEGFQNALQQAQILILLLPETAATENTLNAETLAMLPKGARIINPGRGPLIDDAALLAALDSGQIAHASLDVFRQEPLPMDHPFWAHPRITVTPHIAAETRPLTAAQMIAKNIQRGESSRPFLNQVNRQLGY